jgi:hypothetical protein
MESIQLRDDFTNHSAPLDCSGDCVQHRRIHGDGLIGMGG